MYKLERDKFLTLAEENFGCFAEIKNEGNFYNDFD